MLVLVQLSKSLKEQGWNQEEDEKEITKKEEKSQTIIVTSWYHFKKIDAHLR